MIKSVEELTCPPVVGEIYRVPCVKGTLYNIGFHKIPSRWWPVIRPAHEDSKYLGKFRTIWAEVDGEWVEKDEIYYERNPELDKHIHVDPRFAPADFYTAYETQNEDWHNIISVESGEEWREMACLREMPVQRLFTGFGERFVSDHQGKKLKCMRCPHKGVSLASIAPVDGVLTCPAHGLRYDEKTHECISRWERPRPRQMLGERDIEAHEGALELP